MTRIDLASIIAKNLGYEYTPQQVNQAIGMIMEAIVSAISSGERVEIRGFGTFSKRVWGSRHARNPYTKESWMTEPRGAVHFKPGKVLRDGVSKILNQASKTAKAKNYEDA